jgi:hypothetical protein
MVKMEAGEIENKIEELRETLNSLPVNRTSSKMVRLSQELDSYIVAYQKAYLQDNGLPRNGGVYEPSSGLSRELAVMTRKWK